MDGPDRAVPLVDTPRDLTVRFSTVLTDEGFDLFTQAARAAEGLDEIDVVMHDTWEGESRLRVYHGSETVALQVTDAMSGRQAFTQMTPEQAEHLALSLIVQAASTREER